VGRKGKGQGKRLRSKICYSELAIFEAEKARKKIQRRFRLRFCTGTD